MKICMLRLSAIGDVCNCIPVLRALQRNWPNAEITWIVGKAEYTMLRDIKSVRFVVFDKDRSFQETLRIRKELQDDRFDVLLHMQASIRANMLSLAVRATRRIGFDWSRSRDLHALFINEHIPASRNPHVLEGFMSFASTIGVDDQSLHWDLPVDIYRKELGEIRGKLPGRYVVISPCASNPIRNWSVERYAEVIDYLYKKHAIDVVMVGGGTEIERQYGEKISRLSSYEPVNMVGLTSLRQLMALISESQFVISPDSGPAHMATAVGAPVIGLYAVANPGRTGPYLSQQRVINRYPEALFKYTGKDVEDVRWGRRLKSNGAMDLITTTDVFRQIDDLMDGMR